MSRSRGWAHLSSCALLREMRQFQHLWAAPPNLSVVFPLSTWRSGLTYLQSHGCSFYVRPSDQILLSERKEFYCGPLPGPDRESYRVVNAIMKPLLRPFGFRSLAHFQDQYERSGGQLKLERAAPRVNAGEDSPFPHMALRAWTRAPVGRFTVSRAPESGLGRALPQCQSQSERFNPGAVTHQRRGRRTIAAAERESARPWWLARDLHHRGQARPTA